jgi:hypothetical protein
LGVVFDGKSTGFRTALPAGGEILGESVQKRYSGYKPSTRLGRGPIRTVRTAKDPAQSRPGTSTQWASGAGVQTSGFTADPRSSESLYLRFNRRLIGFGTLPKIPSCLILYRAEFKGLNRPEKLARLDPCPFQAEFGRVSWCPKGGPVSAPGREQMPSDETVLYI